MTQALITRDRDGLSGEPVLAGARVPVKCQADDIEADDIEAGDSINVCFDALPRVSQDQMNAFLNKAGAHPCAAAKCRAPDP